MDNGEEPVMAQTAYTIRLTFATPLWIADLRGPLMIDGVLLAAAARYAFGDQALWRTPDAPDWEPDLPLPLAKSHGVWHIAAPRFPAGGTATPGIAVKRGDPRVLDASGRRELPGNGPLRSAFLTPSLWTIPEMAWDVDTDGYQDGEAYLRELLALLPGMSLGGWRRQGYGMIRTAELMPRHSSQSALWTLTGQPRRAIPVAELPPGWQPDWTVTTIMPQVPNPPRATQPAVLCALPAPETWVPTHPTTPKEGTTHG